MRTCRLAALFQVVGSSGARSGVTSRVYKARSPLIICTRHPSGWGLQDGREEVRFSAGIPGQVMAPITAATTGQPLGSPNPPWSSLSPSLSPSLWTGTHYAVQSGSKLIIPSISWLLGLQTCTAMPAHLLKPTEAEWGPVGACPRQGQVEPQRDAQSLVAAWGHLRVVRTLTVTGGNQ